MQDNRAIAILDFVKGYQGASSKEIHEGISISISYATTKRLLTKLTNEKLISVKGQGKGTKYFISSVYELLQPVDLDKYYEKEIDERKIKVGFNFNLISDVLFSNQVFTVIELERLNNLQKKHAQNISELTTSEYKNELERLAIDLSWKSSQIEGNTYSLLETERLLKDKETASGKTKEEAIMLLNHKDAIDFIIGNPGYLTPLSISKIEDIHGLLVKDLAIDRNLRRRRVGISGTNYSPPDNEFQISEALAEVCNLINNKNDVFEKALLSLVLISYIQPFMDGNKRTARIVSNAILMDHQHCPLSFRTVDSLDYKKAMLLFYEQNNISSIRDIFINQFEFAVTTYF